MRYNARLIAVIIGSIFLLGFMLHAQLVTPIEDWKSSFDYSYDVAWGIAAASGIIAVVGNHGLLIYNEDGTSEVRVATNAPQRTVIIVKNRIYTGGKDGISAYSFSGTRLWTVNLADGCQQLAVLGDETLIGLSGQRITALSLTGTPVNLEGGLGRDLVAITARGTILVTASAGRMSYIEKKHLKWSRAVPFTADKLALDSVGNVWAIGDGSVWLISGTTGNVVWKRKFVGTPTAISTFAGQESKFSPLGSPAAAVVTGYLEANGDKDYWTVVLNHDGEVMWRTVYDSGNGDDIAHDVAITEDGKIIVTGSAENVVSDASKDDYLTVAYSLQHSGAKNGTRKGESSPPIADFRYSPDNPDTYSPISFDNLSHDPDGIIVAYSWRFGDGTQLLTEDAKHAYLHPGDYPVTLTVVDNDGLSGTCTKIVHVANRPPEASWEAQIQTVNAGLTADFTWSVDQGQHGSYPQGFEPEGATDLDDIVFNDLSTASVGGSEVKFKDTSDDWDGEIVNWNWEFGDGETSDEQNPTHHYKEPGTYHVVLTVTDDGGATGVYERDIDVTGGGEIASWEWKFGDEGSSAEQSPTHWFRDDGTYPVTLTVKDASGNSDSVTKEIDVINVPPVADFGWHFEVPENFLPSCDELFFSEPPAVYGYSAATFGESSGGTVCQKPEVPDNAGLVAFDGGSSVDADGQITKWQWSFGGDGECYDEGEYGSTSSPRYIYLTGEGYYLYRGDVDVTLQVWDDDNDSSEITKTVTIGNIPPYAIFDWWQDEWNSWSELDCEACGQSGDPVKTESAGQVTVTRMISSWDCGGEEGGSAVVAPWSGAGVELEIEGSGTVNLTETIPAGWSYWIDWTDECVTITEQGDDHWSATIDLDSCGGMTSIGYELYPPYAGPTGTYTIHGTFNGSALDSTIVLCATVDVEAVVEFHGWGYDDFPIIDPNGDDIAWDWDFGEFGSATGQDPSGDACDDGMLQLTLTGLAAQYDSEMEEWEWSYDLPVYLTVTDAAGGSTTAAGVIHLTGYCGGGAPE